MRVKVPHHNWGALKAIGWDFVLGTTRPRNSAMVQDIIGGGYIGDTDWPAGTRVRMVDRDSTFITLETVTTTTTGETQMVGGVYTGVVVKTTKIPAGTGVQAAVDKSEIVFESAKPFVARDDAQAKQLILMAASAAPGSQLDPADPTTTIDVLVIKYS